MLQFDQLSYQIDNRTLVNHVSGEIHDHDFIVITGQSGSGKSLLLKLLSSLLPMSAGHITLNGKNLTDLTPAIWRSQVAYIAQLSEMIEGSVLDNLALPFSFALYKDKKLDVSWHEQHLVNLGKSPQFLQQDSRSLSGGEKQLVNLLRTLQLHPTILLLDEPTASLDTTTTHQVETLINHWYQSTPNASVVWISHEPTQIQRLLAIGTSHWTMANGQLSNDELTIDSKVPASMAQGNQP